MKISINLEMYTHLSRPTYLKNNKIN